MESRAVNLILTILVFFLPLFFWTLTPNFFATPKELIFSLSTIVLVSIYLIRLARTKTLILPHTTLTLPLLIFIGSITLSLAFNPEGRPEALAGKGLILLLLPLSALVLQTLPNSPRLLRNLMLALIYSTTLLSLHTLASLTFLSSSTSIPSFMQNKAFTPTGSYLTTLTLLFISLGASADLFKSASSKLRIFLYSHLTLSTIAIVAIISLMLPGSVLAPTLIPYQVSWGIALDALKSFRSLLFGIGISNYSLLYTAVKPLSLNATNLWNIVPSGSSSELLNLLATSGVLSTFTFIFLIIKGFILRNNFEFTLTYLLVVLSLILSPATLIHYILLFLILALSTSHHQLTVQLTPRTTLVTSLSLGLIVIVGSFSILRPFASEYFMRRAQIALTKNNGKAVYDNHLRSLALYPKMTSYHLSFASVNLNLASALSQKPELNDEDRQTVTRLIQQAIQSDKTAITLRPNDATTHLALASTYRNIINVADGSSQFAIDAYERAITLDRANPTIRLQLGGLFYQLSSTATDKTQKDTYLARAKAEFQTAIQLKKDYPNAYYNLAKTYEINSDYTNAITLLQEAIKYLPSESSDYQQALAELETLKSKQASSTEEAPIASSSATRTDLATPSPLPSPLPGGPIELE